MRSLRRSLVNVGTTLATIAVVAVQAQGQNIPAGQDCFSTPCVRGTIINFGGNDIPPIPPGFFGIGSDQFTGPVEFGPPNPPQFPGDTLIDRLAAADLSSGSAMVPIQIVQLDLVSCTPITVTQNGGMNPTQWEIRISLDGPQGQGQMMIFQTVPEGGVFDTQMPVQPKFDLLNL